jgi:hypothetical protein
LVGYIFCIIDCHICQDIFSIIDIIYSRLPYVFRGALPLKTLVLYIYRPRGTMQYHNCEFPKFDGTGDPLAWLNRYKRYFRVRATSENKNV